MERVHFVRTLRAIIDVLVPRDKMEIPMLYVKEKLKQFSALTPNHVPRGNYAPKENVFVRGAFKESPLVSVEISMNVLLPPLRSLSVD